MRVYEDHRSPDEWAATLTLKLEDDGTFFYDELWTCYVGNAGGWADGRWWQSRGTIFLHTERVEGNTHLNLLAGRDRTAIEEGDILKFSEGLTYRLRKESNRNLSPPEVAALPAPIVSDGRKDAPRKLSPELAARVRQWIGELPAGGFQNRIASLGKRFNMLPLHTNSIYMWALDLEGVVMWLDHEAFGNTAEQVTNPLTIYAALVHGSRRHRELAELIPSCPEGVRLCDECGGMGWKKSPEESAENCFRCNSLGWHIRAALR